MPEPTPIHDTLAHERAHVREWRPKPGGGFTPGCSCGHVYALTTEPGGYVTAMLDTLHREHLQGREHHPMFAPDADAQQYGRAWCSCNGIEQPHPGAIVSRLQAATLWRTHLLALPRG